MTDLKSLGDVLSVKHCLAVVTSQSSGIGGGALAGPITDSASAADYFNQQSLVLLHDTPPPTDITWTCVPLLGLSTLMREWVALQSIKSHRLMPLAPYITLASPVVSSQMLT